MQIVSSKGRGTQTLEIIGLCSSLRSLDQGLQGYKELGVNGMRYVDGTRQLRS